MFVPAVSVPAFQGIMALPADDPFGGAVALPDVGPGLWVLVLVAIVAVTLVLRVVRSIGKIIMVLAAFGLLGGGSLAFLSGLLG